MKRVSGNQFGDLINASAKCGDEFDVQVALVTSPVVKKALEAQKKADEQLLQDQILTALDTARVMREERVQNIRVHRKQIDAEKRSLDLLDAAEEVAKTTGDFRPLLAIFGVCNAPK